MERERERDWEPALDENCAPENELCPRRKALCAERKPQTQTVQYSFIWGFVCGAIANARRKLLKQRFGFLESVCVHISLVDFN